MILGEMRYDNDVMRLRLDQPRCDDIIGRQKPGKVFAARGSFWAEIWGERERERERGLIQFPPPANSLCHVVCIVFPLSILLASIRVIVNHPALEVVSISQLN